MSEVFARVSHLTYPQLDESSSIQPYIFTFQFKNVLWLMSKTSKCFAPFMSSYHKAGRTLRRRQRSPCRAEQRRFLWCTRLNMWVRVEREGRAAQFCFWFCLRHALFRTQFCNAAHAGQSSAGFCDSHFWICLRELRGRAGQHSSTSAFACATSI